MKKRDVMKGKILNVLLICAAGMSSSRLLESLKKAAGDLGIPVKVKAIPVLTFMDERLEEYDIVLLSPAVRHWKNKIQEALKDHPNIPLSVIDYTIYGLEQGDKLMKNIIEILGISPK